MADLLGIYLDDHLAALTGGAALARRAARNQAGRPWADRLAGVADALAEDRRVLHDLARAHGTVAGRPKALLATVGERVGRLKLNGHLLTHSPLSDVTEIEGLLLVTRFAEACWEVLRGVAAADPRLDAAALRGRAEAAARQVQVVESLHREVAAQQLAPQA